MICQGPSAGAGGWKETDNERIRHEGWHGMATPNAAQSSKGTKYQQSPCEKPG